MNSTLATSRVLSILIAMVAVLATVGSEPSSGQEWARKMFKVSEHDFGTVARGATAEYAFEFENLYEEPLRVVEVRTSCGCTTPVITKKELKTFEKSQILAKYNTRSFLGQKGATITVIFDKPYYAEVQLEIKGYIRSDVVFDPGSVDFGEVDQFAVAEQTLNVSYAGRADWKVVDVRSANQHFEVKLKETERGGGKVGYQMKVRLKDDAPAGHFQDQLTLVTDDNRLKTIPLLVQGKVVSPLTVAPASLFLGVLEPGESVTKQLVVKGKQPFRILKIECDDDCFEFKMPGDKQNALHFIPVTFTADSAGKISQKIKIETDLGSGAVTTCLATATVRAAAQAE